LKNLGFTMYFNAAQINEADELSENATSLSSYFNSAPSSLFEPTPTPKKSNSTGQSIGGISGMSLDYTKGLVTGLLRMIYERDSRRKFLPKDHWLLTSRLEMEGFITNVVSEEENRNKVRSEDDDEDDYEDDGDPPDSGLVGGGRTRQIRNQQRLQRQQRKESRKRYLQAVAPRLEILQNMPFVIPFKTRVQIFREFVRLDQVSFT
jgi:ubiquitin-protein ligase E3 C